MQTKYLCVLIHIWTKGEVGTPLNWFKPSSKIFYWLFQGGTSFVHLFFCLVFAMPLYASVYKCLVVTCWERADLLALVCGVLPWGCYFPIGILGQVWYLIVSIPDLCTLTYFKVCWAIETRYNIDSVCLLLPRSGIGERVKTQSQWDVFNEHTLQK